MDTILSFFTSNKNINLIPNEIPSRDVFLQTETYNKFTGGAEYNKDTYIGHLKLKKGGMKIVKGDDDDRIKKERNIVLEHLHTSLKGGNLDSKNIPTYYKALEGGYIRNLMCPTNSSTCRNFIDNNKMAAYKLSKNALKNGYSNTLKTFKQNAPKLYKYLKESDFIKKLKYKRDKYANRLSDGGSVKSDSSLSEHLSNLRNNVGTRNLSETGGLSNADAVTRARKNDLFHELEELRDKNKGRVRRLSLSSNASEMNETGGDIGIPRSVLEKQLKYAKEARDEELDELRRDKGRVRRLSETSDDIILRRLKDARRAELRALALENKGLVSNLSSPASSPAPSRASSPLPSPIYSEDDRFYGGGDPLQELRMELGR